jgi:eukaryotic-like serine/threonine-protein kinase
MSSYRIAGKIGSGGMATVHLAIQDGMGGFEKLVAFKRMMGWVSSEAELAERFLKEARLAAALSHPNIVSTLAVGTDDEGLYIVMEYIRGESVAYMLSALKGVRYGIPVPVACHIAAQVAAGLDYAHTLVGADGRPSPIVHRDVSPSNVMVSYNGSVKLLDFGIATRPNEDPTRTGTLQGKLTHMAPEQLVGVPADPRSDVFQLGILLWEMLTMRRLFPGATDAERIHNVLYREIVPPSSINDSVPPELDAIVLSALERSPERRCPSAAELQERIETSVPRELPSLGGRELRSWLATAFPQRVEYWEGMEREAVTAPSVTSRPAPAPARKRAGVPWGGVALAATVAMGGGIVTALAWFRDDPAPEPAAAPPPSASAVELAPIPAEPSALRPAPARVPDRRTRRVVPPPAQAAPDEVEADPPPPQAPTEPPAAEDPPEDAGSAEPPPPDWRVGDDILDPFEPRK